MLLIRNNNLPNTFGVIFLGISTIVLILVVYLFVIVLIFGSTLIIQVGPLSQMNVNFAFSEDCSDGKHLK